MRTLLPRLAAVAALLLVLPGLALAREVVDVTGTRTVLAEKPSRIVALAPSLGELVADIAGEELGRLVGVTEYTDYPPALAKLASVGPYHRFKLEAVVALKPDLILATRDGNMPDQIARLRELRLPVVVVATESFADVEASIRLVGEAMGASEEGRRMAAQFATGLARFRERAAKRAGAGRGAPRVLVQVSDSPVVVAGGRSFLNDAVAAIGARNVYANLKTTYPRPSSEDLLARDPEVIIVVALGADPTLFRAMARSWLRFARLSAVRAKRIHILSGDPLTRPTLRLLEGLSRLEKAVYEGVADAKS
ncbi:MAG: helical backbone metal receptor [Oligoflexia bacterium]|nr:helical backbone metal receptor [Oligoflexia bacterium]